MMGHYLFGAFMAFLSVFVVMGQNFSDGQQCLEHPLCYTRMCWPVDHGNGYTLQCDEPVKGCE